MDHNVIDMVVHVVIVVVVVIDIIIIITTMQMNIMKIVIQPVDNPNKQQ